jgi:hypothetical protein
MDVQVGVGDLLGQDVDLDERALGEGDVDAGSEVDGSSDGENEIKRKGSAEIDLEQTRNLATGQLGKSSGSRV